MLFLMTDSLLPTIYQEILGKSLVGTSNANTLPRRLQRGLSTFLHSKKSMKKQSEKSSNTEYLNLATSTEDVSTFHTTVPRETSLPRLVENSLKVRGLLLLLR